MFQWATSGPLLGLENKVLGGHSHVHRFVYFPPSAILTELNSQNKTEWPTQSKILTNFTEGIFPFNVEENKH